MSYRIYTTEAFVLANRSYGEADRLLKILTPELGGVNVLAKSLRLEKSKLRYGLQLLHHSNISLVRGRDFWRLVNAEVSNELKDFYKNKENQAMIWRIFALLNRLIHGELENRELFFDLKQAFDFLDKIDPADNSLRQNVECVLVLRLLKHLGYLSSNELLVPWAEDFSWLENDIREVSAIRREAIFFINQALKNTHL